MLIFGQFVFPQVVVRVAFSPSDVGTHRGALVIRNNLTVVDVVTFHGIGGQGSLKFGNRKPGDASTPLVFNVGSKHLKDCDGQFMWLNIYWLVNTDILTNHLIFIYQYVKELFLLLLYALNDLMPFLLYNSFSFDYCCTYMFVCSFVRSFTLLFFFLFSRLSL